MQTYEDRVANVTQTIYRDLNSTLYSYRAPANESLLPRLSINEWTTLNRSKSDIFRFFSL